MQEESPIQYKHGEVWKNAKCDLCLYSIVGDRVDIEWNKQKGQMKICRSQSKQPSHEMLNDQIQIIRYAQYCHGQNCPLQQNIQKNPDRNMKPCACVLLQEKENHQILITKRTSNLSFPGAWVLPGGHLELGQNLFQGGIRQCQEQVGLPHSEFDLEVKKSKNVMIWQSVFTSNNNVKSCGLVVFFTTQCPKFDVKMLESQVCDFKWKKIEDTSDQIPYDKVKMNGYAQGHRRYLNIIREKIVSKL